MDLIKIILSVMIGRTSCFSLLHSYVYESLDRNELLNSVPVQLRNSNKEICTQSF